MRQLGANVVRIHLQFHAFMEAADRPNAAALERLKRLTDLADRTGLYLDITGLACYDKPKSPSWYDAMEEPERWAAQGRFWEAVAGCVGASPAVFCYDIMNEPVVPGELTRYDIEIFPTAALIAPGHRLRLALTTYDFPSLVPIKSQRAALAGGVYQVRQGGLQASSLLIPLADPESMRHA